MHLSTEIKPSFIFQTEFKPLIYFDRTASPVVFFLQSLLPASLTDRVSGSNCGQLGDTCPRRLAGRLQSSRYLLKSKHVPIEVVLDLLVGDVYAELLERISPEVLESKNIQYPHIHAVVCTTAQERIQPFREGTFTSGDGENVRARVFISSCTLPWKAAPPREK